MMGVLSPSHPDVLMAYRRRNPADSVQAIPLRQGPTRCHPLRIGSFCVSCEGSVEALGPRLMIGRYHPHPYAVRTKEVRLREGLWVPATAFRRGSFCLSCERSVGAQAKLASCFSIARCALGHLSSIRSWL